MQYVTPTESQRAGLRCFETMYARWAALAEALAAAELRLWSETLRQPGGAGLRALADEVLRLRQAAQDACPVAAGAGRDRTH